MKKVSYSWQVLNNAIRRGQFGAAVFDFDGTLSLIREGWSRIMSQLGQDLLTQHGLPVLPGDAELFEDEMLRLSGKPSIFQMRRLAEILHERGGPVGDPEAYLQEFLRRLFQTSEQRKAELRSRRVPPSTWTVPGTHGLLEALQARGVPLYLASGTDLDHVREEAELLDLIRFFGEEIHAPHNNSPNFRKRDVMERILERHQLTGPELLSFGDGYSETVEAKRLGGVAVGLATVEPGQTGLHPLKARMLQELGADLLIPDYTDGAALLRWLFAEDDDANSPSA